MDRCMESCSDVVAHILGNPIDHAVKPLTLRGKVDGLGVMHRSMESGTDSREPGHSLRFHQEHS